MNSQQSYNLLRKKCTKTLNASRRDPGKILILALLRMAIYEYDVAAGKVTLGIIGGNEWNDIVPLKKPEADGSSG